MSCDGRRSLRSFPVEPSSPRAAIGSRLRAARQVRSLTIAQVAESAGLTKGFLSRVERDHTSPSVATLVAICEVLDISIGDLFESSDAAVVRRDEAPKINLGGSGTREVLLSPRHDSRFQLIRSVVEPGGNGGAELYTISAEVEALHVLSGTVEVRFGDAEHLLNAGDSVTFAGSEPHQWQSASGAELLWVLVPAAWGL